MAQFPFAVIPSPAKALRGIVVGQELSAGGRKGGPANHANTESFIRVIRVIRWPSLPFPIFQITLRFFGSASRRDDAGLLVEACDWPGFSNPEGCGEISRW